MTPEEDIGKLPDFPAFSGWVEPTTKTQKKIVAMLNKEKTAAGLRTDVDILFLEVGTGDEPYIEGVGFYGSAHKNTGMCNDYLVRINEHAISKHRRNTRRVVRHEIAHIKYGDCENNLPVLMNLFSNLVYEPRARAYAHGEFVEPYSHDCASSIKRQIALFSKNN